jgi:hypothetical protein
VRKVQNRKNMELIVTVVVNVGTGISKERKN